MRVVARSVLFSLLVVVIATGASAKEPFIALADVETGRALVPEGSVVPAGVRFFVTKFAEENGALAKRERVPLVFAYAPASQFDAPRKAIEATRASAVPLIRYVEVNTHAKDFRVITNGAPEWFYLYFADGSYTSALRHVDTSSGSTYYGSGTVVYSDPGPYWTGTIWAYLSSSLSPDPYDDYNNTCTIGPSGGTCSTQYPYHFPSQPFSATVYSEGQILQRFGGCWTNPNSPCLQGYSGTIEITFP